MGFKTKIDISRQTYQKCKKTVTWSGSTNMGQNLKVSYKSGSTYNFNAVETTGGTRVIVSINQEPILTGSAFQLNPATIPTGTGSDLEIDLTTGEVFRNASSAKYKFNIIPLDERIISKLLLVEGKKFQWHHNGEHDIGFIAEEFHNVGLTDWVIYNGVPSLETVEGLKYKQITAGLLELVKLLYRNTSSKPLIYSDEAVDTVKVIRTNYTTKNDRYVITKDNKVTITLDPTENNRHYIKSMTDTTLVPHKGLIDEMYEEINMGPQSSVELIWVDDTWYVLSSDGLKTS